MFRWATRRGIFLKPGHRRRGVVENQYQVPGRRLVVDHFHDSRDAAVDERAVADDADDFPCVFFRESVPESQPRADARAMQTQQSIALNGGSTPSV